MEWSADWRIGIFMVILRGSGFEQISSCGGCLARNQSRYQQSMSPHGMRECLCFLPGQKALFCTKRVLTSSMQSLNAFAGKSNRVWTIHSYWGSAILASAMLTADTCFTHMVFQVFYLQQLFSKGNLKTHPHIGDFSGVCTACIFWGLGKIYFFCECSSMMG